MLEARALECTRGDRTLFRDVSFTLANSGLLHVAGDNGSGKTTLLRILTGLGAAQAGEVLWCGEPLFSVRETYARDMVYVGHSAALKDDLSALENLHVSMLLAGLAVTPTVARRALAEFGLEECLGLPARLMSQGQRRRAVLARVALSADAPLWILDEPFNALDKEAVLHLEALLTCHVDAGGMLVITTHQDAPITTRATQRLVLADRGARA
jgi:heme exporter protein A